MTNANTDRRVIFGFLLAFALLALIPLLVYQNRGRLINDSQQVAHTVPNAAVHGPAMDHHQIRARSHPFHVQTVHITRTLNVTRHSV